jgi:hypothetical protein
VNKFLVSLLVTLLTFNNFAVTGQAEDCPQGQMRVNDECGDGSLATLKVGWNKIEPGGETRCAHGDPYRYWVRPGTSNKLLIHFEGGGGCWSYDTCKPGSDYYDAAVGRNEISNYQSGIFDLDNSENPFSDYTFVFAPVCTGDVHMGNNVQIYESAGRQLEIYHRGFVNSSAAVEWAYQNLETPESVFVTGCSAGSMGSIMFAPYLIDHYKDAPVYQLGDSLAYVFHRPVQIQTGWHAHDNFAKWIPELEEIRPGEFTSAHFYSAIANFYPDYTFAQFNSLYDSVQQFFYTAVGGEAENWAGDLQASLDEIHANSPNFRTYVAGGTLHCITPRNAFYTYATNGVRFVEWVRDLANGKPVEDVHCTDCEHS